MVKLKRPEFLKDIHYDLMGERFIDDMYWKDDMDSFLSEMADELENISELTYYQRDENEAVTKNLVRPKLAKIIKALRGDEK